MNLTERQRTAPALKVVPPNFYGQGRRAATILACEGDVVTVITDSPYKERTKRPVVPTYRGARAMHLTTLRIPSQNYTSYQTTAQRFFSGRKDLAPAERRTRCSSQHMSQLKFGPDDCNKWDTKYSWDFPAKETAAPAVLHYPAFNNKMNMNEGSGMKTSLHTADKQGEGSSFTQYSRIHNRLGVMRGPGVARDYPARINYDPLTGTEKGKAWQSSNERVSGNRVLYNNARKDADNYFVLG